MTTQITLNKSDTTVSKLSAIFDVVRSIGEPTRPLHDIIHSNLEDKETLNAAINYAKSIGIEVKIQ